MSKVEVERVCVWKKTTRTYDYKFDRTTKKKIHVHVHIKLEKKNKQQTKKTHLE